MLERSINETRNNLLKVIMLALVTAGISIGYFIIKDGGFLVVVDDYNTQQMTFTTAVHQLLTQEPAGEWYWGLDLGSSAISAFSFYNLGSIFFWPLFFLPAGAAPYAMGFVYIIKYIVAAMTAFFYLKLFVRDQKYAVIGAIVYAFSGFQSINLEFFHFHDVVALFPLLLIGLECFMKDRKYGPLFVFAVFINCLTNYFFFIQEVVFLVIYFLFRYWELPKKVLIKQAVFCTAIGTLGTAMAAVLFVPSVIFVLDSPRSQVVGAMSLLGEPQFWFRILKGMLMPSESMRDTSAVVPSNWRSTSCYLPLFGMSFVIAYVKNCKGWLRRVIIFLLVISFSPLLQAGFIMFTSEYQRWWFMLVLLMVLATVSVLDDELDRKELQKGILLYLGITAVFFFGLIIADRVTGSGSLVFIRERFWTLFAIVVLSQLVLLAIVSRSGNGSDKNRSGVISRYKNKTEGLAVVLMLFAILTTSLTMHYYRIPTDKDQVKRDFEAGFSLPDISDQFRYATAENFYTISVSKAGVGAFTSTKENSSWYFDSLFGIAEANFSTARMDVEGMPQLLGGKYHIKAGDSGKGKKKDHFYVTEKAACPIGFSVGKYIMKEDFAKLDKEHKVMTLMQAALIDAKDEAYVAGAAQRSMAGNGGDLDMLISKTMKNKVSDFSRDARGFKCRTSYNDDRLVYFSVPYDAGWSADIDGKNTRIVDSGGMMLLKVPEGKHKIVFEYKTPGLRAGITVSCIAFLVFLAYAVIVCRKKNKATGNIGA